MGRDKARLPIGGTSLVQHVAAKVAAAAGSAVLVGEAGRLSDLGYPVIPDLVSGRGPLGGIETALEHTAAAWNLIVACDMPDLSAAFLTQLLEAAERSSGDCLIPVSPAGLEPLCAAYHRDCLDRVRKALACGVRAVHEALRGPGTVLWPVAEERWFRNLNTPKDLAGDSGTSRTSAA